MPPLKPVLQCQAEMDCAGVDEVVLVALCLDDPDTLWPYTVKPHHKAQTKLREAVTDFWEIVQSGKAPKPNYDRDGAALSAVSLLTPKAPDILRPDDPEGELDGKVAHYMALSKAKGTTEREIKALKAEFLELLMDYEVLETAGHRIKVGQMAERQQPATTIKAHVRLYPKKK